MKYIFLLAMLGCSDVGGLMSDGVGGSSTPSDGLALQDCLSLSAPSVDFGTLNLDALPASLDLSIEDNCSFLAQVQWGLDDPDEVFEVSWTAAETFTVTLTTSELGSWEAQYIGELNNSTLSIQIFGETVEGSP